MNPVITLPQIAGLIPELIVTLGAFVVLTLDMFLRKKGFEGPRWDLRFATGFCLLLALSWLVFSGFPAGPDPFAGVLASDGLAAVAKALLVIVALATLFLGSGVATRLGLEHGEYYALLLFSTSGMMFFAGAESLMFAFVALETFSLAMYVLAGFNKRLASNREAALKYFLLGAYGAAFFLFGMALVYGSAGGVDYGTIGNAFREVEAGSPRFILLTGGLLLVTVALAFKVGLAPFHLWVPDTYEGAPTPVTAFLSAGAKIAGFAAVIRLGAYLPLGHPSFTTVISVLAVLTMTLANIAALRQTSIKRLLAFSSVSHSGYALIGLAGGSVMGGEAVVFYVLVYTVMNFLAFGLLTIIESSRKDAGAGQSLSIQELSGLGFEKPLLGAFMAVAMFSMAGLPPTAGFIAKFMVFKSAVDGGAIVAAVFAALNSVVAAAYYLRVLVVMYMKPSDSGVAPVMGIGATAGLGFCAILLLVWGLAPASGLAFASHAGVAPW